MGVFARWGYFVYRRRLPVLALSLLLLLLSGVALAAGGDLRTPNLAGAESTRAGNLIAAQIPQSSSAGGGYAFDIVFGDPGLRATSPRFRAAVRAALAPLRRDGRVARVATPYDGSPSAARSRLSRDGHYARVTVSVKGDFKAARAAYPRLRALIAPQLGFAVAATGDLAVAATFNRTLDRDLQRAERVSLPLALILLLLVFGAVVAALLPLGVGLLSVVGGVAGVYLLTRATDVSQYALNVVTLVGLGVAIDYSLFIVNRFREELARGASVPDALARALATAGRAIAFSGLTVAIGLAGLLFYRGTLLASMGLAGAVVVALAVVYALTFLPAVLALLGPRVNAWQLPLGRGRAEGEGLWRRLALAVMRRPALVLLVTVPLLLLAGSPFLGMRLAASSDLGSLPPNADVVRGGDLLRAHFGQTDATYIPVVALFPGRPLTYARAGALYDLTRRVAALRDVARVESPFAISPALGRADYQRLYDRPRDTLPAPLRAALRASVGPTIAVLYAVIAQPATSDKARAVVRAIRGLRTAGDGAVLVAGLTAYDIDSTDRILADTPAALAFIVGATYLVLFLLLGSVLLPLKAVVTDVLSISASFGAMVWIFQQGNLRAQLNFAPSPIDPLLPVLLFCIVFGLSMDYEVLLLSRIKESYERSGDNRAAVAEGLERSGRLVTGAAAIMVVVFAAFALADVSLIKALGLGLALAVAIDATIVRALVVPATMRLLGGLNWWAPLPLARLHRRLGLAETSDPATAGPGPGPAPGYSRQPSTAGE